MRLNKNISYINYLDKSSVFKLNRKLNFLIDNIEKDFNRVAFVCIGTDRATGDSYGPLVGHMLSRTKIYEFDLYGNLDNPVHATNLCQILGSIDMNSTLIIGIDSCLGLKEKIGKISIGFGGIKPGSGVGKDLPIVGDIHIAAIVNQAGFVPNLILQCTRLNIVYKMAEITATAIKLTLYQRQKLNKKKKSISVTNLPNTC